MSTYKDAKPECLNVESWRTATPKEMRSFLEQGLKRGKDVGKSGRRSVLAVRRTLAPVDVYCYLKARFGEPNGIQNFLRKDQSDNLFHWDYALRAGEEGLYIAGQSREIQLVVCAPMSDEDWRDLILAMKRDFQRVGKDKSSVFRSLEHWVIFPNRYVAIAGLCADLHATIAENVGTFQRYHPPSGKFLEQKATLEEMDRRATGLYRSSLQLSLLTPILAEAFINLLILTFSKPEIKNDPTQFEEFIRSRINHRLMDLPLKCDGIVRPINQQSKAFKNFLRVMNKRNDTIHGNHNPEREKVEDVYFEGTRPLFIQPGDPIGKFFESLERQYCPEAVIKDYEQVHEFLAELTCCLRPDLATGFQRIVEDPYPGFDIRRKKMGGLFPGHYISSNLEGVRFDDELDVTWPQ